MLLMGIYHRDLLMYAKKNVQRHSLQHWFRKQTHQQQKILKITCSFIGNLHNLWYIHSIEYYATVKKNMVNLYALVRKMRKFYLIEKKASCRKAYIYGLVWGLPQCLSSKESACNAGAIGNTGSIPHLGRSHVGGHGNWLQYSCLGDPMYTGAWWVIVHCVAKELDMTEVTWHMEWFYYIWL